MLGIHNNTFWQKIPERYLSQWQKRLLCTRASVFQYPFWNESLRTYYIVPTYLLCIEGHEPAAYVCILTIGFPPLRIGIVRRGPVSLLPERTVSLSALKSLQLWAKTHGYIFLRFTTGPNIELLQNLKLLPHVNEADSFPFYKDLSEELIVDQKADDTEMLTTFQAVARQEIKKADKLKYDIQVTDSPEAFERVWPIFQLLSNRKGFHYRPLKSYLKLISIARPDQCVRLYTAFLKERPVESVLIIRDRDTSHYLSGALDVSALPSRQASPSCLLQWRAMRDFFNLGAKYHNLGTKSGKVYQFKRKFRPTMTQNPPPLTLVANQLLFFAWSRITKRLPTPSALGKLKKTLLS